MSSEQEGEIYIKVNAKGSQESHHDCEWDDGPGGQVRQILLWHGAIVYGIQTSYERNGTSVISKRHGGTEGDFEVISLDEPLTWISGHYGSWCCETDAIDCLLANEEDNPDLFYTVIRSLKFGTREQTYGPFGNEVGTPFSFKMSTGCAGFHGKDTECYLLAIGVYVRGMAKHCIHGTPSASMIVPSSLDIHGTTPAPMIMPSSSKSMFQSTSEAKSESSTSGAEEK